MKKKYVVLIIALVISCSMLVGKLGNMNKKDKNESNIGVLFEEDKSNDNQNEDKEIVKNEDENEYENEQQDIQTIVEPGYEAVENFLDCESANGAFQGVALVAQGDEIKFAKAYGNASEGKPNTLNTRFAAASITKQFTAAAIMQLVDEGKVNIDDTIDKYFPEYIYGNIITVRNLLQMRSGIPDYLNDPYSFMNDAEAISILKDYEGNVYPDKYVEDKRWSHSVLLNSMYKTGLLFDPNVMYDYCNTNYYLLGLIVENVTGKPYEEYVQENLFAPSNMTTASMNCKKGDAEGHGSSESGVIKANSDFTYAAGNIYTNVFDLFRWSRALHTGKIVSSESYAQMTTPIDGYGFGLFVTDDGVIRHSGVIDGFNSNIEYHPYSDVTIIVMENKDAVAQLLDAKYDTSVIAGLVLGN